MNIRKTLEELKQYQQKHRELEKTVIQANSGTLYPLDLLVLATLNRSAHLLRGFISLVEDRNFIAAAPLIRLQLDNCLRLFASTLVEDPHQFTLNIIAGQPVRRQRDRDNELMTDKRLVSQLAQHFPWVEKVYEVTSSYIHLSEKHFFHIMQASQEDRSISILLTDKEALVPDNLYLEAITTFRDITDILFGYLISGWIYTKNNPQRARQEWENRFQAQ